MTDNELVEVLSQYIKKYGIRALMVHVMKAIELSGRDN